jgi:hypothetical protein
MGPAKSTPNKSAWCVLGLATTACAVGGRKSEPLGALFGPACPPLSGFAALWVYLVCSEGPDAGLVNQNVPLVGAWLLPQIINWAGFLLLQRL